MNVLAINPFSIVAPLVLYVVYKVVQYKQEAEEKYLKKAQFYKKGQIEFEKMYNEKKQELQTIKKVKEYDDFQQTQRQNRKRSYNDFSNQYKDQSQVPNREGRPQFSYNRLQVQKTQDQQSILSNQKKYAKPTKVDMVMPQQQMVCHLCTDCVLNKLDEKKNQRQKKQFKKSNMIDLSEIANKEEDNSQSFLQYYKRRQNKFYDILKSSKELNKIQNQDQKIETQKPPQFNSKSDLNKDLFLIDNKDQFIKDKPNSQSLLTQTENQSKQQISNNILNNTQKSDVPLTSLPNKSTLFDNKQTSNNLFNNKKDDQKNLFQNKDTKKEDQKIQPTNSLFNNNKSTVKDDQQTKNFIPQPSISFDNKNPQSLLSKQNTIQELPEKKNTATFNNQSKDEQKSIGTTNKVEEKDKPKVQNTTSNTVIAMRNIDEDKPKNTNMQSTAMLNNNQKNTSMFNNNNQKVSGMFNNNVQKSGLFNNDNTKNNSMFNNNDQNKNSLVQNNITQNKDLNKSSDMFQQNKNQNQQQGQNSLFTNQQQQNQVGQNKTNNVQMPQPNNPPNLFNKDQSSMFSNKNNSSQFQSQPQNKSQQPGPFFSPNSNNQKNTLQSNKPTISNQNNQKNPFLNSLNNNSGQNSLFTQQAKNYQGGLFQNNSNNGMQNKSQGNMFSKSNNKNQQQQNSSGKINTNLFNNSSSIFGNKK